MASELPVLCSEAAVVDPVAPMKDALEEAPPAAWLCADGPVLLTDQAADTEPGEPDVHEDSANKLRAKSATRAGQSRSLKT